MGNWHCVDRFIQMSIGEGFLGMVSVCVLSFSVVAMISMFRLYRDTITLVLHCWLHCMRFFFSCFQPCER